MNVYALTPTGMRPEGMALLGEYLNAQSYQGPLTWIIVDDCDPCTRIPYMREGITTKWIRPGWRWQQGMNTQVDCMRAGLEWVPDDAVLFILEDDDAYLPDYITTMLEAMALDCRDLVGERSAYYYNVASGRYRTIPGKVHSSMASTVCRREALELLKTLCIGNLRRMLDVTLWKTFAGAKMLLDTRNVIGIKGLPGRPGIGVGHRARFGSPDINNILQTWIGEYADNYNYFRSPA
jgi:hypothetical protein